VHLALSRLLKANCNRFGINELISTARLWEVQQPVGRCGKEVSALQPAFGVREYLVFACCAVDAEKQQTYCHFCVFAENSVVASFCLISLFFLEVRRC